MLRMKPVQSAKRACLYYEKSDAGYYRGEGGLHCEWGGKVAGMLGLGGPPDYEQFKRLVHGLDPRTGEQLTAKLVRHRIPAWDLTASVPKGVTVALERGDSRIQAAIWESVREAMGMVEGYATTRVRVGGQHEDRVTGNMAWYAVEHAETRPVEDEELPEDHPWRVMPMPDRHVHVVVPNVTFDDAEGKWKAVKFRPIMDIRRYFDRSFDTILAGKLRDLGYEVETRRKASGKYHSWDIKGIPAGVVERFSRRTAEVDAVEQEILARMEAETGVAPDALSAVARDKLGATSRREKRDDLTLEECRSYWDSLVGGDDARAIAETLKRAMLGLNPKRDHAQAVARAVDFAVRHHGEQESCIRWEELAATAMERCIGLARPDDIEREARRQGVIFGTLDGVRVVSTPELRAEERFISDFAAAGQGAVAPLGRGDRLTRTTIDGKRLNDGQFETACGLLQSQCRVNLVEGPAGAGKTSMLAKFDEGLRQAGRPVAYLATTAKAAEVLQRDGFDAHTLAHFLLDERMQAAARGGVLVVDEVSMLGHKDAYRLFKLAETLDVRLVMLGDPMQHRSVGRGEVMRLLKEYGGIRAFKLDEILRQKDADDPRYLAAVKQLSEGRTEGGFNTLDAMGWVREVADPAERYQSIATDYLQALDDKKSVLVVSPTHAEGACITQAIRSKLQDAGKLNTHEREFTRLVSAETSEAERGEAASYRPGDVLVFHQNAKGFKKGTRYTVTDPAKVPVTFAGRFSHYRPETIALAEGDRLRFTGTVNTRDGKHSLKNGMTRTVAGFTKGGDIRLSNGWVVPADAGLWRHGYVETSFGSQGSTVQRAILAVSAASLPATNQEQMYVSASRAKDRMTLYTDDKEAVREAAGHRTPRLLASDLERERRKARMQRLEEDRKRRAYLGRVRAAYDAAPPRPHQPQPPHEPERQVSRGR